MRLMGSLVNVNSGKTEFRGKPIFSTLWLIDFSKDQVCIRWRVPLSSAAAVNQTDTSYQCYHTPGTASVSRPQCSTSGAFFHVPLVISVSVIFVQTYLISPSFKLGKLCVSGLIIHYFSRARGGIQTAWLKVQIPHSYYENSNLFRFFPAV